MSVLVYDVETLRLADEVEGGWDNIAGMGFGSGVIYDYEVDQYRMYMPQQQEIFEENLKGNKCVSWNGDEFDIAVILGENNPKEVPWTEIDLLTLTICNKYQTKTRKEAYDKYGKLGGVLDGSLGLGVVCESTLGVSKSGSGKHAPLMTKTGAWGELFTYNLKDVRLLRKLFEFVGKNKYLIDGENNRINILKFVV